MSYLYKKAGDQATSGSKIDANQLQTEIDKRNTELNQIKGSLWANDTDRTLMAALIGAGVGGVGGLLLAPKSETKNNFKRKLRYALLGAGIGGLGGAGLMYGGIGGLIDSSIDSKQKEIDKLVAAKENKVDPGVDYLGDVFHTLIPSFGLGLDDKLISARNKTPNLLLAAGDWAALTGASALGAGTLAGLGAYKDNKQPKWLGGTGKKVPVFKTAGNAMFTGNGKRAKVALSVAAINALAKYLTGGAPESAQQEGKE